MATARPVLDHVGAGDDVHGPGLGQGLAGVAAFQLGQLVVGITQQFDGAIEDAGPLDRGEGSPGLLALPGAGHGVVDVGVVVAAVVEHGGGFFAPRQELVSKRSASARSGT